MRPTVLMGGALVAGVAMYLFAMPLCGCSTKTPSYATAMKSDLRNLVTAQESYFADHRTYAGDIPTLDFVPTPGVTVTMDADADSWTGRATHTLLTGSYAGADCVALVGPSDAVPRTTMKRRLPSVDRPVVCDMDGWHPTQSRWARWRWEVSD